MRALLIQVLLLTTFVNCQGKHFQSKRTRSTENATTVLPINISTSKLRSIWIGYTEPKKNRRFDFDRYRYCLSFKKCEGCMTASLFACTWCHQFGCTHRPDLFCPEVKHLSMDYNNSCPSIEQTDPIRKHLGPIAISLKIKMLDPSIYQHGLVCKITLGEKQIFVKGYITKDTVSCERFDYFDKSHLTGNVQLIWGGAAPLSEEVPLTLYSCEAMGRSCTSCKAIADQYECGWCSGQEKCSLWSRCRMRSDSWATGDNLNCPNN